MMGDFSSIDCLLFTAVRFFAEQHELEIQESASVLTVANLVRLVRRFDTDIGNLQCFSV